MINKNEAPQLESIDTNNIISILPNNKNGFFKVYRDLFQKPIWLQSTPEQKSILITLMYMANWIDNTWEWKGNQYRCKPGEFISSYNKIAQNCGKGLTVQNVRTALKRFEKLNFLTYQSTGGYQDGIKVIINNWAIYQNGTNRLSNTLLTDYQQTPNSLLTPNKEYKNIRNNIEGKKTTFKKPSLEEIKNYCLERSNNVDAQRFFDYYSANDWQDNKGNYIKNWKQKMIAVWEPKTDNTNYKTVNEETIDYANTPYRGF